MRKADRKEIVRQFNIEYIAGEIEARRGKKQLCRHWRLIFGSRWLPFFLIRHFGSRRLKRFTVSPIGLIGISAAAGLLVFGL